MTREEKIAVIEKALPKLSEAQLDAVQELVARAQGQQISADFKALHERILQEDDEVFRRLAL